MAEALAAGGVAASLLQLTDALMRTCLCLHAFFSALHDSRSELHRHTLVIRDVHDVIQMVRRTVVDQNLHKVQGHVLKSQLNGMTRALSTLEKATAGKDPTKFRVRIAWVLKSVKTDRELQRLENYKTALVLLLQALSLDRSKRILCSQSSMESHLTSLKTIVEQQGRGCLVLQSQVERAMRDLGNSLKDLDSILDRHQQSLDEGFSNMRREIQASGEHAGNTIYHGLKRQLQTPAQRVLAKPEAQDADALGQHQTAQSVRKVSKKANVGVRLRELTQSFVFSTSLIIGAMHSIVALTGIVVTLFGSIVKSRTCTPGLLSFPDQLL